MSKNLDNLIKHVQKGWGYEKWIVNKSEYCGKLLYFNKGKKCSWHYHKIKDEVFYIQSGKILLRYSHKDDLKMANVTTKTIEKFNPKKNK